MELTEFGLIDIILAAVVGTIIMVVFCLLARKPKSGDKEAQEFGGLVGFFVYRLGKRIKRGKTFRRFYKDTPQTDKHLSKERFEEIKDLWQNEPDKQVLQAVKDIEEYSPEIRAIIRDEAICRGLIKQDTEETGSNDFGKGL